METLIAFLGIGTFMYLMAAAKVGQLLPASVAVFGGLFVVWMGRNLLSVNRDKLPKKREAKKRKQLYEDFIKSRYDDIGLLLAIGDYVPNANEAAKHLLMQMRQNGNDLCDDTLRDWYHYHAASPKLTYYVDAYT